MVQMQGTRATSLSSSLTNRDFYKTVNLKSQFPGEGEWLKMIFRLQLK